MKLTPEQVVAEIKKLLGMNGMEITIKPEYLDQWTEAEYVARVHPKGTDHKTGEKLASY